MIRVNDRTVILTHDEQLVHELFEVLLDRGYGIASAVAWLCQDDIPSGLQSATPLLDSVLSPEFREYLSR